MEQLLGAFQHGFRVWISLSVVGQFFPEQQTIRVLRDVANLIQRQISILDGPFRPVFFYWPRSLPCNTQRGVEPVITYQHSKNCSTWVTPNQVAGSDTYSRLDSVEDNPDDLVQLPKTRLRR